MGCISSYLVVAATTPNVIPNGSFGNRANLRRQQATRTTTSTRNSTATTATTSSRSSTSKPNANASNTAPPQPQIFTISRGSTHETASLCQQPAKSEIKPHSKSSTVYKPTAASIARRSTASSQHSTSPTKPATRLQVNSSAPIRSVQPKPFPLSKAFAKSSKVRPRQSLNWKSAPSATLSLNSATPTTTASTASSSKSPPSTSSTSEFHNSTLIKQNAASQEPISIDQLLGIRLDSARLQKIIERKKSQSESSKKSSDSSKSKHLQIDHLQIAHCLSKELSPNISVDTCWEYAIDANHQLYKVMLEPPARTNPPTPPPPGDLDQEADQNFNGHKANDLQKESRPGTHHEHSLQKSQHSIFSQISATSYPMSQVSRPSVSSMSQTATGLHSFDLPPDVPHSVSAYRYLQPTRGQNLRQYQSDSMNNQFIPSTTTSTLDSTKDQNGKNSLSSALLPEHEPPKLELISQPSFDSELQRKYSEVSRNFKPQISPDSIHLPSIDGRRRQSDQMRTHRPSIADRKRSMRKAQTLPNLVFDEADELLSLPSGRPTRSKSPESTNIRLAVQRSDNKRETPSRPITSTMSTCTSNADSLSDAPPNLRPPPSHYHKLHMRSKSPSMASSRMSNRFESLLRHRSFLKTAASTVTSLGIHSRRDSENSTYGAASQKAIQVISEHRSGVNCLELSEDRSLLVSGGEDGKLRLWSTFSTPCECIGVLVGHKDYITCCTVYRLMVISGSADRSIKLWSIEDGNCLVTLTGHSAFINRVACYGPLLLSTSFDATARVWTLSDRLTVIHHLKGDSGSLESDEIGGELDGDQREILEKWKGKSGSNLVHRQTMKTTFGGCLHILQGHDRSVTQVAVIATDPGLLDTGIVQELDIVVTTSADGTARTWSLATGEQRHILSGHTGPVNCLALDPKETQYVYTAGADWTIKCWDVITGEHLRDLKGHQNAVLCLVSHNRILYSGSADNTARAWAMEFGQCTRIYYRNTSSITCIQYFNGSIYTGSNDHSARLYDSNSGVLKQTFTGHHNAISALKVVPGKMFTASFDGKILVWDCEGVQGEIEANGGSLSGPGHGANSQQRARQSLAGSLPRRHSKNGPIPKSKHKQSRIGASLLNHTLELFPDEAAQAKSQHTRETLYPQLQKKKQSDSTEVNEILEQVLTGKKKRKRRASRRNSSAKSISCFGHRIWPDYWLSLSSSSSAKSSRHRCWKDSSSTKLSFKKTKVRRIKPREAGRDHVSTIGRGHKGETLNQSIRVLIEPTNDNHNEPRSSRGQKVGKGGRMPDDSANVQRAIKALEPYLRSFK